jgi:hypothetical protein
MPVTRGRWLLGAPGEGIAPSVSVVLSARRMPAWPSALRALARTTIPRKPRRRGRGNADASGTRGELARAMRRRSNEKRGERVGRYGESDADIVLSRARVCHASSRRRFRRCFRLLVFLGSDETSFIFPDRSPPRTRAA